MGWTCIAIHKVVLRQTVACSMGENCIAREMKVYCKGKEVYCKGRCTVLQYIAGIHCWKCIAIKGIVFQYNYCIAT